MNEISEEFYSAAVSGGTSYTTECACGRTHFCDSEVEPRAWYDHEDQDDEGNCYYNKLIERAEKDPDKCIKHNEGIAEAHINGEMIVIGCPCERDVKIEKWIWSHRDVIAKYINARAERELREKLNEYPGICIKPTHEMLDQIEQMLDTHMEAVKKLTR
jgi:hypothetical protein